MNKLPKLGRRRLAVGMSMIVVLASAVPAWSFFSVGTVPGSAAAAGATSVGRPGTPTAVQASSSSVTLTWPTATFATGAPVDRYVLTRAAAGGGASAVVGAGCSGTIHGLACTELDVPPGSWTWRVTGVVGTSWRGPESASSNALTIGTSGLALTKRAYSAADFATNGAPNVFGTLAGFGSNEPIQFRLGSALGTLLQSTPPSTDVDGKASVSIVLSRPADGTYTIHALGGSGSSATAAITVDTTPATSTFATTPSAPDGASGWYVSPTSFALSAADAPSGAAAAVSYTRNGGSATPWTAPVPVADGIHQLTFWSTDGVGNREADQARTLRVDTTAPVTSDDTARIGNAWTNLAQTVNLTAVDATSGVAATRWTIDGSEPTATSTASTSVQLTTDGVYAVRYASTDVAGNREATRTAATSVRIDRTAPATGTIAVSGGYTDAFGSIFVRGGHAVTSTATDPVVNGASSGVATVAYHACAGECTPVPGEAGTVALGQVAASPFQLQLPSSMADGDHRLVTRVLDAAGNAAASTIRDLTIDATAPTSSLISPVANALVRGTVTPSASSFDGGSGVQSVSFEVRLVGATTWTEVGAATSRPFEASWDTRSVADGDYDMRVVAADNVGNATMSTSTRVSVDNTAPSGTISAPSHGSFVRGTISITTSIADSGSGVVSAVFQVAPAGSASWSTIATVTAAPWGASYDTTLVVDGTYNLRVVTSDAAGNETTSGLVQVTVDNTPPRAADVQAGNRTGGTLGRPETNDTMTFTYSEPILPASILAGWTGSSTTVTVRFVQAGTRDTLQVWNGANTAQLPLGSVQLNADLVTANTTFSATMQTNGNAVVVTLGSVVGTSSVRTGGKAAMTWSPSTAATDRAGNACVATAVTETGTNDADF